MLNRHKINNKRKRNNASFIKCKTRLMSMVNLKVRICWCSENKLHLHLHRREYCPLSIYGPYNVKTEPSSDRSGTTTNVFYLQGYFLLVRFVCIILRNIRVAFHYDLRRKVLVTTMPAL